MALQSSQRLGPYEILAAVGAGGMGEVYRARDTRLDRTVAIKVLPGHLADKPELRERFEREAKTVASLNHPHICTLYDVGHQNGTDYLVMEYLEGETLAERLKKGPLPLDQVLRYAIEISDALDKAHRKGITHRDLKPSNILLTKSGAKLLDFGLAKLKQDASPVAPLSQRPTAESGMTAEGTILGTLQYMAPEQVEGKTNEIDARTDIFAFGAVVYEIATGKKAFEGKTQASVMAKILEVDPPSMVSLQPMTPPQLDRVVKRCLAKEPDQRWQAASDLSEALKWIAESSVTQGGSAAATMPRGKDRPKALLWAGAAVAISVVVGLAGWFLKPVAPAAPKTVTRFGMSLPPGTSYPDVAFSPDGSRLVYAACTSACLPGSWGPGHQLYVRTMDGLEARQIPGTEGAMAPFFSPDGQWVVFSAGGKLKKIPLSGGAPISLAGDVDPVYHWGASWSSQGIIAFAPNGNSPILQIPDSGGSPQPLVRPAKGEVGEFFPVFLPGSRALLFVSITSGNYKVSAQFLTTGERRDLLQLQESFGVIGYVPSGHLLYDQEGNLMAAPFDAQRLALTGPAVPVIEGVARGQWGVSSTGSLVYVPGSPFGTVKQSKLVWVDRKGIEQMLPAPPHDYEFPRLSPDGKRVAVGIQEADTQIWLYDVNRDALTRLTFEKNSKITGPTWTPDGKKIVFKGNENRLFWQPADGSGPAEEMTKSKLLPNNVASSFSPDGQILAFMGNDTNYDLYTLSLRDGKPQPFLLNSSTDQTAPHFSPDGHFIAYASTESGRYEIYVRPYPGPGGKYQISTEGGNEPVWNPKGKELFYRSGDKMMAVGITTQPSFTADKPRMIFQGPYLPTPRSGTNYDISPDGQRFLMLRPTEQAEPDHMVVVQNWFEELKQKVPAGKK